MFKYYDDNECWRGAKRAGKQKCVGLYLLNRGRTYQFIHVEGLFEGV